MYRIATNESITHINKKKRKNKITDSEYNELALENLESDVYFEGDVIQLKLQKLLPRCPIDNEWYLTCGILMRCLTRKCQRFWALPLAD